MEIENQKNQRELAYKFSKCRKSNTRFDGFFLSFFICLLVFFYFSHFLFLFFILEWLIEKEKERGEKLDSLLSPSINTFTRLTFFSLLFFYFFILLFFYSFVLLSLFLLVFNFFPSSFVSYGMFCNKIVSFSPPSLLPLQKAFDHLLDRPSSDDVKSPRYFMIYNTYNGQKKPISNQNKPNQTKNKINKIKQNSSKDSREMVLSRLQERLNLPDLRPSEPHRSLLFCGYFILDRERYRIFFLLLYFISIFFFCIFSSVHF